MRQALSIAVSMLAAEAVGAAAIARAIPGPGSVAVLANASMPGSVMLARRYAAGAADAGRIAPPASGGCNVAARGEGRASTRDAIAVLIVLAACAVSRVRGRGARR